MSKKQKPKERRWVTPDDLSKIAMTAGNEKRITKVIDMAPVVLNWVGIGWVNEGVASDADLARYPAVKRAESVDPEILKRLRKILRNIERGGLGYDPNVKLLVKGRDDLVALIRELEDRR